MAGDELNELLDDAPSDVRQALSHPYRRQVLRILLANGPMSSTEIAGHPSAPCRVLCLARHVRLLGESSLLIEERVTGKRGMAERFFSAVPLPSWIREVLAETEELDRGAGVIRHENDPR